MKESIYLEEPDPPTVEPFYLRVADLRQYAYCPRFLYYFYCLPDVRPLTFKMEEGEEQHLEEKERERCRGLSLYSLQDFESSATKHFDVNVESERLCLRGRLDMVIEVKSTQGRELYPVEYKATRREPGPQYRLQLAAYSLLLEEQWQAPVRQGFFLLMPVRKAVPVRLDKGLKAKAEEAVRTMHAIVRGERIPPPASSPAKCFVCEFRRFCNDIL